MRCLFSLVLALVATGASAAESPRSRESFDDLWRFHLGEVEGAEAVDFDDAQWRELDLPHDWSAEGEFSPEFASGTGYLPGGVGWYRKTFTLPEAAHSQRFTLELDGVSRNSTVWINGVRVGHRPNGYVSFYYDITEHVRFGDVENVVAVRAERENVADSRWYPGTGIYRHVWLTRTEPIHVAPWGVFVTTPRVTADSADICAATEVVNRGGEDAVVQVVSRILTPEGEAASEVKAEKHVPAGQTVTFTDWQKLPRPRRWSPADPNLYMLVTEVSTGERLVDEVRTPLGIRTLRFDPDEGFFLNGEPTLIKGVCVHHDGGVVGAAVPEALWRRRLELVKQLGANAVRCSHNPMAPEFYDLCDELGLLVMDEAFDEWELGKRKWVEGRNVGQAKRFGYSEAFEEWAQRDLAAMIRAHRNHPSIILWSIGNEIDYPTDPYVHSESRHDPDFDSFSLGGRPSVTRLTQVAPKLISTIKYHDPTRPVTMALANVPAANGIGLADMLDVAGYNYQEQFYEDDHRQFPGRVIVGSENGRGLQAWEVVRDRPYISGLFYWVGFDFLGEANRWPNHGSTSGIFDRCGFLKPQQEQLRAVWSDEPVVRLVAAPAPRTGDGEQGRGRRRMRAWAGRHWNWAPRGEQALQDQEEAQREVEVTVFANTPTVELFLNGRSLGERNVGPDGEAQWRLPFEPGELRAVGSTDGKQAAADELTTAGEPVTLAATTYESEELDPGDVAHVTLQVVDASGAPVPWFGEAVTVSATGGEILGVDAGNQFDPTPLGSHTRTPLAGRLLVIVEKGVGEEPLTIKATAEGLEPLSYTVNTEAP